MNRVPHATEQHRRNLGAKLSNIRGRFSQTQIAQQLGKSQTTIHRWEKGEGIPADAENLYRVAVAAISASTSNSVHGTHQNVHRLLKIVNCPFPHVYENLTLNKEIKPLPTQIIALPTASRVFDLAARLVRYAAQEGRQKIWIFSNDEYSAFDPPVDNDFSGTNSDNPPADNDFRNKNSGVERIPLWQNLLHAVEAECEITHIFRTSANVNHTIERLIGIAPVIANSSLRGKRRAYRTVAVDVDAEIRIAASSLVLVPGIGMVLVITRGKQHCQGLFIPDTGSESCQTFCSNHRRMLESLVEKSHRMVACESITTIRSVFKSPSRFDLEPWVMSKNGLYVLMVPRDVCEQRLQRLEKAGLVHSAAAEEVRENLATVEERLQRWKKRHDRGGETVHLFSQAAILHFAKSGDFDDGSAYWCNHYRPGVTKDPLWQEHYQFKDEERARILQSVIQFIADSHENYRPYFLKSYADHKLDDLAYHEDTPGAWWAVDHSEAYLLLGQKSDLDPQAVIQIIDVAVSDAIRAYFNWLIRPEVFTRGGTENRKPEQLKWLKDVLNSIPNSGIGDPPASK